MNIESRSSSDANVPLQGLGRGSNTRAPKQITLPGSWRPFLTNLVPTIATSVVWILVVTMAYTVKMPKDGRAWIVNLAMFVFGLAALAFILQARIALKMALRPIKIDVTPERVVFHHPMQKGPQSCSPQDISTVQVECLHPEKEEPDAILRVYYSGGLIELGQMHSKEDLERLALELRLELKRLPAVQIAESPQLAILPKHNRELDAELQVALTCEQCDAVYRVHECVSSCQNCGCVLTLPETGDARRKFSGSYAYIEWMMDATIYLGRIEGKELLARGNKGSLRDRFENEVKCGWCDTVHPKRPDGPNCGQCGGTLPLPNTLSWGPAPPNAPRRLPTRFVWRLFVKGNGAVVTGTVLLAVAAYFWSSYPMAAIPLGAFAVLFIYFGTVRRLRRYLALKFGNPIRGQIEAVHITKSDGAAQLRRIFYRFGDQRSVKWTYFQEVHYVGQPIWVLQIPWHAQANDIWPS